MNEEQDLNSVAEQAATIINRMVQESQTTFVETEKEEFVVVSAQAEGPYLLITCTEHTRYGAPLRPVKIVGLVKDLKIRFRGVGPLIDMEDEISDGPAHEPKPPEESKGPQPYDPSGYSPSSHDDDDIPF